MAKANIKHYGVKHKMETCNDVERAVEQLRLVGYTCIDSGYDQQMQGKIQEAFEKARLEQQNSHGGEGALRAIDEHNTIRCPFSYNDTFLELSQNPKILDIVSSLIGGSHATGTFVLNQQNGITNPAGQNYNQAAYHRDLPYQHFTSSRPLAINALYCIDPFTAENGATLVVPGTHKSEPFPSDETISALEQQVLAPAGSFLVLDCMVYHSGAPNKSQSNRRAVNHVYTVPLIRQQIDIPALLGPRPDLPNEVRRLLGYNTKMVHSLDEYFAARRQVLKGRVDES